MSNAPLRDKQGKPIRDLKAYEQKQLTESRSFERAVEAAKKNLPTALSRFPNGTISGSESEIVEELIKMGCLGGKKSSTEAAVKIKKLHALRDLDLINPKISDILIDKMKIVRNALECFAQNEELGVHVEQDGDWWTVGLIETTFDFNLDPHFEDPNDTQPNLPSKAYAKYPEEIQASY